MQQLYILNSKLFGSIFCALLYADRFAEQCLYVLCIYIIRKTHKKVNFFLNDTSVTKLIIFDFFLFFLFLISKIIYEIIVPHSEKKFLIININYFLMLPVKYRFFMSNNTGKNMNHHWFLSYHWLLCRHSLLLYFRKYL